MATRQRSGARTQLIRCANCGEDYSATYKSCPFCDESSSYSISKGRSNGGRRVSGASRRVRPLRVLGTLFSLGLIVAACVIVFNVIKPLIDRGNVTPGTSVPPVEASAMPSADPSPSQDPEPSPSPSLSPIGQTATGFALGKSDFTLYTVGETYTFRPTFTPEGTTGDIVWSSSNSAVATVSLSGTVTAVGKGTATVTASMGDVTATCIVRCNIAANSPSPSGGATGFTLNKSDFTLSRAGDSYTIKAIFTPEGATGAVTWSSSNDAVATVSASGTVTAVSKGTVTITATMGGATQTCIVRCSF